MPVCSRLGVSQIRAVALAAAFGSLIGLCGCIAGRTFVLEQPAGMSVHCGLTLRPVQATVAVDSETLSEFDELLAMKLSDQLTASVGPSERTDPDAVASAGGSGGLIVQYRFTLFDEGEGVVRVGSTLTNFVGSPFYGMGDGAVGIEVRFLSDQGALVGHIVTNGTISGAFGSVSAALDEAADSIAKYTRANFPCPTCVTAEDGSAP